MDYVILGMVWDGRRYHGVYRAGCSRCHESTFVGEGYEPAECFNCWMLRQT